MAQGHENSSAREVRNVIESAIPVGGHGDQADETVAGSLPASQFITIRRPHMSARMSAAGAVSGREMRTFHMHKWNHVRGQVRDAACRGNGAKGGQELFLRSSDQSRQEGRNTLGN